MILLQLCVLGVFLIMSKDLRMNNLKSMKFNLNKLLLNLTSLVIIGAFLFIFNSSVAAHPTLRPTDARLNNSEELEDKLGGNPWIPKGIKDGTFGIVSGLLFDPDYEIAKTQNLDISDVFSGLVPRTAEEVKKLLRIAKKSGLELKICAPLRGFDGPGSSQDIPEFQLKLTKVGAKQLNDIPSTPTMASVFTVTIKVEILEDDPDAIVYVAEDYGITAENPYRIEGEVKCNVDGTTPKGQKDGPAYIFRNIFGLKGIKITCESINPIALAGGMESSNAFNIALFSAASMLSGQNWNMAKIFSEGVRVENEIFGGLTGGQGHLCCQLGGAYIHNWLSGITNEKGEHIYPYAAFSMKFVQPDDFKDIEDHLMLVQAGKEYKNGKASVERTAAKINNMWTALLKANPNNYEGNKKELITHAQKLHFEKLVWVRKYVEAMRTKDMGTVVKSVNRYVDIRDEICQIYYQTLASPDEIPKDNISEYSGAARELIQAARKKGIAIMPLGAGGPGANMMAVSTKPGVLKEFFEKQGLTQIGEKEAERARRIIRGQENGTIKGFMPYTVGKEGIIFSGFEQLAYAEGALKAELEDKLGEHSKVSLPAHPYEVEYSQDTGRFSRKTSKDIPMWAEDFMEEKLTRFEKVCPDIKLLDELRAEISAPLKDPNNRRALIINHWLLREPGFALGLYKVFEQLGWDEERGLRLVLSYNEVGNEKEVKDFYENIEEASGVDLSRNFFARVISAEEEKKPGEVINKLVQELNVKSIMAFGPGDWVKIYKDIERPQSLKHIIGVVCELGDNNSIIQVGTAFDIALEAFLVKDGKDIFEITELQEVAEEHKDYIKNARDITGAN